MTEVVNLRDTKLYDIYIGRPGYFGNPFVIGRDGSREEVVQKYKSYAYERLGEDPEFRQRVKNLSGKVLGCWCSPLPCHGDVLAEFAEAL